MVTMQRRGESSVQTFSLPLKMQHVEEDNLTPEQKAKVFKCNFTIAGAEILSSLILVNPNVILTGNIPLFTLTYCYIKWKMSKSSGILQKLFHMEIFAQVKDLSHHFSSHFSPFMDERAGLELSRTCSRTENSSEEKYYQMEYPTLTNC